MLEIVTTVIGVFIYLFIFWKRLNEDYIANQLFSAAFIILLSILIGYIVSRLYFGSWWFWAVAVGMFIGTILTSLKYRIRYFEVLEASFIGLLPWLILVFAGSSLINKSILPALISLVIALFILLFIFLDTHYKRFTWYRSGRAGFSGILTISLLFLVRSVVAGFNPGMISFVGKVDILLSAAVAVISFLALIYLARLKS
jgi:hypothetical protein